jgi:hypothetical protein
MLGWFRRHWKIRNNPFYFLVSCFAVFVMKFSQSSYECGLRHVAVLIRVMWAPWAQIKLI